MGIHANNRDARLSRIYCEGVKAQKDGDLITTNPWDVTNEVQQRAAWDQGWNDSNGGAVDLSMCCYPVAGAQAPELSEVRY